LDAIQCSLAYLLMALLLKIEGKLKWMKMEKVRETIILVRLAALSAVVNLYLYVQYLTI
jgi:hypothetical protein